MLHRDVRHALIDMEMLLNKAIGRDHRHKCLAARYILCDAFIWTDHPVPQPLHHIGIYAWSDLSLWLHRHA